MGSIWLNMGPTWRTISTSFLGLKASLEASRLKDETKLEADLNAVSNSSVARPWKLDKMAS